MLLLFLLPCMFVILCVCVCICAYFLGQPECVLFTVLCLCTNVLRQSGHLLIDQLFLQQLSLSRCQLHLQLHHSQVHIHN